MWKCLAVGQKSREVKITDVMASPEKDIVRAALGYLRCCYLVVSSSGVLKQISCLSLLTKGTCSLDSDLTILKRLANKWMFFECRVQWLMVLLKKPKP